MTHADIVAHLRSFLKKGDVFIVPHRDRFLNGSALQACDELLHVATGFSGSAGTLLITHQEAILFVDGRYTLQAQQEIDSNTFSVVTGPVALPTPPSGKLFFDPWLHSAAEVASWKGWTLSPVGDNPLRAMTTLQPTYNPIVTVASDHSFQEKARALWPKGLTQPYLLCSNDDSAWLLNLRGSDVPMVPIFQAYTVISYKDGLFHADVFTQERPTPPCADISFHPFAELSFSGLYDPQKTPYALVNTHMEVSPLPQLGLLRAQKTSIEREGMIQSHKEDGIALVKFLHWLSTIELDGTHTEFSVAQKLEVFRKENPSYRGKSFETIASMGKNSAVVHYHPSAHSSAPLVPGIFLLDSGGHYPMGTTDVTRTVVLGGNPTEQQKRLFTAVLQAHIHLAHCRFPQGTRGVQLDSAARSFLWQEGLDYAHGTGHGVGAFLSVHEYPPSISSRDDGISLQEGMIFSNEPGYYLEGAFGFRIESLVLVCKDENGTMRLQTLTMAPIDRRLIAVEALSSSQRAWLDAYHADVFKVLAPHLPHEIVIWLEQETRPLV